MNYPIKVNDLRIEMNNIFDSLINEASPRDQKKLIIRRHIFDVIINPHDYIQEMDEKSLYYGFSFFVAKGANFDYNSSYLFNKIDAYIAFLKKQNQRLEEICNHFNTLIDKHSNNLSLYEILYNESISFTYDKDGEVSVRFNPDSFFSNISEDSFIIQGFIRGQYVSSHKNEPFYTRRVKQLNSFDWEKFVNLSKYYYI